MKKLILVLAMLSILLISGCDTQQEDMVEEVPEEIIDTSIMESEYSNYAIYGLLSKGTEYETEVYYSNTTKGSSRILIIGGTHGNEEAGFLAAEAFLKKPPPLGEIMVIPRANIQAIKTQSRTSDNRIDLNRSYPGSQDGNVIEQLAHEIFELIQVFDPHVVIDLHESIDYHTNGRLGNSIIISAEGEHLIKALDLIDYINHVETEDVPFTFFGDPPVSSLNETVTRYLGIPVFTTETCRMNPIEIRVRQQLLMIDKLIELYGN